MSELATVDDGELADSIMHKIVADALNYVAIENGSALIDTSWFRVTDDEAAYINGLVTAWRPAASTDDPSTVHTGDPAGTAEATD